MERGGGGDPGRCRPGSLLLSCEYGTEERWHVADELLLDRTV